MILKKTIDLLKIQRASSFVKLFSNKKQSPDFPSEQQLNDIYIDKDRIKKKMEEIKSRRFNTTIQNPNLMPKYKIKTISPQIKKFRQQTKSQDLFAFRSPQLQTKPTQLFISAYDSQSIRIDNYDFPNSLIVFGNQLFLWQVTTAKNLKQHHFDILKVLKFKPQMIIISLNQKFTIDQNIISSLRETSKTDVHILPYFEAISTFNECSADLIKIVMFIICQ